MRRALVGISLTIAACGSRSGPSDDHVSLGRAAARSIACPSDASPTSTTCSALTVTCDGMADLEVVVTTGAASPGAPTILLHDWVGGTAFLDDGFVDAYRAAGFRVVQAKWSTDWEAGGGGLRHATCRYATLLRWIKDDLAPDAFCAQSYGGGSGGLAMSLAHYGASAILDAVTVSSGPPFARVDLGCDPRSAPTSICGLSVPTAYAGGPLAAISGWEEASATCGKGPPTDAEAATWRRDSILSEGATLAFPKTSIGAWYCATPADADATIGQGALFLDAVTATKAVHCVDTCMNGRPWPAALPDMVADMKARCVSSR